MNQQEENKKECPLCRSSINENARVCPICRKDIGSWIAQMFAFCGHYLIPIALGSTTLFLCNHFMNIWLNPLPIIKTEVTQTQNVSLKEGELTYAYKAEKVGERATSFLGLFNSVNTLYSVTFAATNHTKNKLTKLRISLKLSNEITSHKLPFGFEIYDKEKEQQVKDLETHFVGKNKVNITIPVFYPEDNFYMRLDTKEYVNVEDISVYSDETKGIKGEFINK